MATHRRSMSGVKAQETEKWGRDTAYARYGKPEYFHGAPSPPDKSRPQFREDQCADKTYNQHPKDWVRGFGKGGVESAEGMPNFDKSKRR
jgi:hypothetical protein